MSLAELTDVTDYDVEVVVITAPGQAEVARSPGSHDTILRKIVRSDLLPDQAKALRLVLALYNNIFDYRGRPLGLTNIDCHPSSQHGRLFDHPPLALPCVRIRARSDPQK